MGNIQGTQFVFRTGERDQFCAAAEIQNGKMVLLTEQIFKQGVITGVFKMNGVMVGLQKKGHLLPLIIKKKFIN